MINIGSKVKIINIENTGLVLNGTLTKTNKIINYIGSIGKVVGINRDTKADLNIEILLDNFRPLPLFFSAYNLEEII